MEPFKVHILGCGSALPTLKHFPSAQVVEVRGKLFLVDCGEGTQIQLRRSRLRFTKISAVFITHLHGDHCFGLIGMLSTFGLLGRTAKLTVYAPAELADILQRQIDFFCRDLDYEVEFVAVDTTQQQVIYDDRSLTVETLPLEHRVHCCGYLFREKPSLPHIRRDVADFYGIPVSQFNNIKAGAGWTTEEGEVVAHERLVEPAEQPRGKDRLCSKRIPRAENCPSYDATNEIGQPLNEDTVQVIGAASSNCVQVFSLKYGAYGCVNAGFLR